MPTREGPAEGRSGGGGVGPLPSGSSALKVLIDSGCRREGYELYGIAVNGLVSIFFPTLFSREKRSVLGVIWVVCMG